MISRISTDAFYLDTINGALNVQSDIMNITQQLSSGVKTSNFQGLAADGQVNIYVNLQDQLSKIDSYTNNNTNLQSQLNTTSQSMQQMISIADNANGLIIQAQNGSTSGDLAFDQELDSYYQQFAAQLNATAPNGQYLFSGTDTTQAAVDPTTFPTNIKLGVPDASYYQGNNQSITATIADGQTVTTNVTGDNPAIQQFMCALATAKAGFDQGSSTLLTQAETMMGQAVQGITATQTSVDASAAQVTQAVSVAATQKTYLQQLKGTTVGADIVSLSTQLANDQATLQASFQAYARVTSLTLATFLPNT